MDRMKVQDCFLKSHFDVSAVSHTIGGVPVNKMTKISILIKMSLIAMCLMMVQVRSASAFELKDIASIGAAYTTHLFFHELGHQVVADNVGADSTHMRFFTQKDGKFYPGLSTCENIPEESKLPYAAGGERMAGYTFEYALQSYKDSPSTFNKALMFFSCADFVVYTLLANYVSTDDNAYDPNLISEEIGCSKEFLFSLVLGKSLLNTYRVFNPDANFVPMVVVDKKSAALMFQFRF